MDRNSLIKRLMATFLVELDEHVRALNHDLLALERDPAGPGRAESFASMLRAAHSLKGAARSVNVGPIESMSHLLEELFVAGGEGRLAFDHDLFALLFASADAIEEAGLRLREQADLSDSPLVALLPHLKAAADRTSMPVPPASTPAPSPAAPSESSAGSAIVRVPAEKLDALLTHSGELLVARRRVGSRGDDLEVIRDFLGRWRADWRNVEKPLAALLGRADDSDRAILPRRVASTLRRTGEHLGRLERDLERLASAMGGDRSQLDRASGLLEEEVRRARMLPFAEACQGLDRTVRDVARAVGKQVELVIEGGGVEIDRSILEGLKDPLRHLVHNAVDHGIEPPERRVEVGKPPQARITVSAALRGAQVEVVVADDGAGLNLDRLREQARQRGLDEPTDARDLERLIFLPGFSTAGRITNISGRGVGLDVVKDRLEQLHGTIELASKPGRGLRLTMALPLTLTTLRALMASAGGQVFAFATTNVQKLIRVGPSDFRVVEGFRVLSSGGGPLLPVASLAEALGLPGREPSGKSPGLIVAAGERRMAFLVDDLLAEQEITVKTLGARVRHARFFSGATIQPSGRIALVINAAGLIRAALGKAQGPPMGRDRGAAPPRKRLLVVDDSATTRTREKDRLESAGFEVTTAVDGEAGWRTLQEWAPDLLISDVEMPRMDGFALTRAVRASARFAHLPVILYTSRSSEADRARGVEAGADAYLLKGSPDRALIEAVSRLLREQTRNQSRMAHGQEMEMSDE
ncbi:hybrid sensor histidine kinase/response regulator [Tundrisphaera lichenicola]|uniref:hybrid sensor histidine kinase/response regulator n=1 Tax=Tundrisphaera lichenicola TaxID=2029860 RepID=UPI003EB69EF1